VENPKNGKPQQFHFWRIMFVCWGVVAFCALSAWVISTYFYE
jgi:hypothetical protein